MKQTLMNVTIQTIHAIVTQRNVSTMTGLLYVNAKKGLLTAQMTAAKVKCMIRFET